MGGGKGAGGMSVGRGGGLKIFFRARNSHQVFDGASGQNSSENRNTSSFDPGQTLLQISPQCVVYKSEMLRLVSV